MFLDHSISAEQWRDKSPERKKEERISIRAYFLWKNDMPGTDAERNDMATFEDQFDRAFYQMECKRSSFCTLESDKLRLLLAEHLVGILRMDPKDINDETQLPKNPALLQYLRARLNYHGAYTFSDTSFLTAETIGRLVYQLGQEIEHNRPIFAD